MLTRLSRSFLKVESHAYYQWPHLFIERYKLVHAKQLENNTQAAAGPSSGAKINIAPQEKEKEAKSSCC